MSRALSLALVLSAAVACGPTTPPAPTPTPRTAEEGPPEHPEQVSLLRRLAEAVDGYRDGRPRFVVAGRRFPHPVRKVTERPDEADSLVRELAGDPANYGKFGPFRAVEDPPDETESRYEVDSVIVFTGDGPRRFDGDSVDALFWGLTAFDKFIAPYLTVVYGAKYAADQRELYRMGRSGLARSKVIPHFRGSF